MAQIEYNDKLRRLAEEIAEATNKNTAYHLPRTAATHAARIVLQGTAEAIKAAYNAAALACEKEVAHHIEIPSAKQYLIDNGYIPSENDNRP